MNTPGTPHNAGMMSPAGAKELVDLSLKGLIRNRYSDPDPASRALAYALAGEGKRVRPVLCLLAAEAAGATCGDALPAALAVEMVHTYSLVHDDLPCMDDDSMRRGRPTTHVAHGEAMALLAGDSLLTDAFALIVDGLPAQPESSPSDEPSAGEAPPRNGVITIALVRELARAAGSRGMVLGQSMDLHWTSRGGPTLAELQAIHHHKTGCLLGASIAMGAIVADAPPQVVDAGRKAGHELGMAFQILDDLLDDSPDTGKSTGKDAAAGKLTFLSLMSRDEARAAAVRSTESAVGRLSRAGLGSPALAGYARSLLTRLF